MKKILALVMIAAILMCSSAVMAVPFEDCEDSEPRVLITHEDLGLQARANYEWTYWSDIVVDVLGTEMERVEGYSICKTTAGSDVYHYSIAYYANRLTGEVSQSSGYVYGYGEVWAYSGWVASPWYGLLNQGRFNYGV